MADFTTRDIIWLRVLTRLVQYDHLYLSDILKEDESGKETTARRVLRGMEDVGLLQRPGGERGRRWERGPLAEVILVKHHPTDPSSEQIDEIMNLLNDIGDLQD